MGFAIFVFLLIIVAIVIFAIVAKQPIKTDEAIKSDYVYHVNPTHNTNENEQPTQIATMRTVNTSNKEFIMKEAEKVTKPQETDTQQIVFPYPIKEPKKIICDVCGYANPENTSICKKCSNYLND